MPWKFHNLALKVFYRHLSWSTAEISLQSSELYHTYAQGVPLRQTGAAIAVRSTRLRCEVDTYLQWLHTQSRHLAWLRSRLCQSQEPATLGHPEPGMSGTRAGKSVVSRRDRTDAARNGSAYT